MSEINNDLDALRAENSELKQRISFLEKLIAQKAIEGQQIPEENRNNAGFYSDLVEYSGALIFVKDLEGRYKLVNKKWQDVTDLNLRDVVGKTDFELFPDESARQFHLNDVAVMETGSVIETEETLETPNGRRYFISDKFPLRDAAGAIWGIGGMITEITERKRAEEALLREKSFIEAIFNSVPGMLYLYSADGKLVRWNAKHEEMSGYSSDELANMCLLDWYKGDEKSQAAVADGLKKACDKGFGEAEVNLQRKDGTVVPMYCTATPLAIDGKEYFTGIGIDITERRQAQRERERLQEQLAQARKMESVGRLAGGVAHDFNNMLCVIIGRAEMALSRISPKDEIYEDLGEIKAAAQRSADLTRQLLAFARKETVAPQILSLNDIVAEMFRMLKRLIGENIELSWSPGHELWPVKMDPAQIDQLLANLCVNARDAILNVGHVSIKTKNMVLDESWCLANEGALPGEYVQLSVSDDGKGMDKKVLEHLFEPFFTTKELGHGTGLGLATVYGVVRQNAGFINVYSEPGQGTIFMIYLPRYVGNVPPEQKKSTVLDMTKQCSETILLVEDEPVILDLGKKMLSAFGYQVLVAGTPHDALRTAEEFPGEIHLLMTDVIMPEMNGRELATRLMARFPNLKCLFTSGYTANIIAHHGVLDEGVHFLQKPFSQKTLATKVREALD